IAAIEHGDYPRAEIWLKKAFDADLAAVQEAEKKEKEAHAAAEKAEQAAAKRRLTAAKTKADLAELKLTQLQYAVAAGAFREAADLVPPGNDDQRLEYLDREANALYRQGDEFGDNPALARAIERLHSLLALRTRERVPLQWAKTQNNLGNALSNLGERESGT